MPIVSPVPFPTSTAPGTHFQESAGRIINGYVEPLGESAPSTIVYRRAPGLLNFGTTGRSGCRGLFESQGILYVAFNGQLEKFTSAGGASTNVGAMTGTKKGFFAANNAATPDKVFVDIDNNIFTFTSAAVTSGYPDPDLPAVNSVTSIDGYLVFTTGNGRAFATDLNSTAVNPLSFGTAEAKPDGLTRGIAYGGQLFLFGDFTTEIWSDVGATPFPFQRAVVIPRGIAGPFCVAGQENGFGRALCWVGDDNAVYRLNGYQPEKISSPDLDGLIEAVTDKTTLEMSVYISRGHAFVQLSSSTWSWVFDLNNSRWAERNSYNLTRSRITGTVNAFGKWLCGDTASGNVQQITSSVHQETNNPFRFRLESGPVEKFPVGARVGRADFNFVTGVGFTVGARVSTVSGAVAGTAGRIRLTVNSTAFYDNNDVVTVAGVGGTTEANGTWPILLIDSTHIELQGSTFTNAYTSGGTATLLTPIDPIETDPRVEISWSDDGGQTYSAPLVRKLGPQSQTRGLVSLLSCTGRSSWNGRRWRLDVADPVYVGFLNATQAEGSKVSDT